ncbi:MAG: NusA-like transcription termination signal-binding factor [Candidatus Woesearchaeota archaeon]
MRKKYNIKLMSHMILFEKLTGVKLKDCIESEDKIIFVVELNQLTKAIGPRGSKVKELAKKLNKKIKIVEYNPVLVVFIRNLIAPLKVSSVEEKEGIVLISDSDRKVKGLIIGKNAKNLREYEDIVKRFFDIKEIKVV